MQELSTTLRLWWTAQLWESKQLAFRVHLYSVVLHLMVYKYVAINPWFQEMTMQDVIDCELLTKHEASIVEAVSACSMKR